MNKTIISIIIIVLALVTVYGFSRMDTSDTAKESEEKVTNKTETMSVETKNVIITTNKGAVTVELFTGQMPITTGNFLKLVEEDFYDGVKFHRVIPGFMVQVGDPTTKDDTQMDGWGTGGPGYTIKDEFVEGLSNVRGTLSMANTGVPNSGGSQFFINVADNTGLDFDKEPASSKHPVFGHVIEGMDVVDAIVSVPTEGPDRPVDPVVIEDIIIGTETSN